MSSSPFQLSIETEAGSYVHGFHLGTDERIARHCAEEIFSKRIPKIGKFIRTVALFRNDRSFKTDYFDGKWSSEYANEEAR
jgi:hypothetical protein